MNPLSLQRGRKRNRCWADGQAVGDVLPSLGVDKSHHVALRITRHVSQMGWMPLHGLRANGADKAGFFPRLGHVHLSTVRRREARF
jgi:hypothetical protein